MIVALCGALDALVNPHNNRLSTYEIAKLAQQVETEKLKQQCGIQDQLASAFGGVSFIQMHQYPNATVECLFGKESNTSIWWELERRLLLVYLGNSHVSTKIHEMVIQDLEGAPPSNPKLEALRKTAKMARDAVLNGDWEALGSCMTMNTNAQQQLHPDLVSTDAKACFAAALKNGALGYKGINKYAYFTRLVNGAGGIEGGSITILCGSNPSMKRQMIKDIEALNPLFKCIPVSINRTGLRVWDVLHSYPSSPSQ